MSYILAIDQGTTSSRALLFRRDGSIAAVAQREFQQHYPHPGWVEHDADEIWQSQLSVTVEAIEQAGFTAGDVAAIGITNQRETTVVWDRATGRPIANAIVWQDRRTAEACDQLKADGHAELIQSKTGLVVDAYFSGTKLAWLLDHVPGARQRAEAGELAFGTIDAWLVWQLTGGREHVTDVSNASRTMLYDIHAGRWDDELLALLDVPPAVLPEVRSSSEVVGHTAIDALAKPIPIAGMAGDQQAALFGQACFEPGMAKNTYGTGCFMLMHTGNEAVPSAHQMLSTVAWRLGERTEFALEGSVFIGGAVVQWLRDGLGVIESAAQVNELAATVDDNGGVVLVPAFTGLGAPHWDPYARGAIVGLTRGTTRGHLCRAALESIAYQVADVLDGMRSDSGMAIKELRADGGAAASDLLIQFQADMLGVPIVRPAVTETTALGAAYLAGLAVGYWKDRDEIAQQWQVQRRFEPSMPTDEAESLRYQWRRALDRAKGWVES